MTNFDEFLFLMMTNSAIYLSNYYYIISLINYALLTASKMSN